MNHCVMPNGQVIRLNKVQKEKKGILEVVRYVAKCTAV